MPIYECECSKCLTRFELKRHFGETYSDSVCPECGHEARRLFSPVPIVFKGSGFYITDSRKDSQSFTDNQRKEPVTTPGGDDR
jgi:putative FmdB family regulatory protein